MGLAIKGFKVRSRFWKDTLREECHFCQLLGYSFRKSPRGRASHRWSQACGTRLPQMVTSLWDAPPTDGHKPVGGASPRRFCKSKTAGNKSPILRVGDVYYFNLRQAFREFNLQAVTNGFPQQCPGYRGVDRYETLCSIGLINTDDTIIHMTFN